MFRKFKNWRTTFMGVAAIMAALADIVSQIAQQDWDSTRFGADVTGFFTGLGLIFARDAVASEEDHRKDRMALASTAFVATEAAVVAEDAKKLVEAKVA